MSSEVDGIGRRLKEIRTKRATTLTALAKATGISASTISRLESGGRQPNLELLIPLVRELGVGLDALIGTATPDPRVPARQRKVGQVLVQSLSPESSAIQTFRMRIPASKSTPEPGTHEGYDWLYVLSGNLRLVLGEHDIVMGPGEAAEFNTQTPHWMGSTGDGPVEILSIFGRNGERIHLRARTTGSSR